jgi:hypothetical protein
MDTETDDDVFSAIIYMLVACSNVFGIILGILMLIPASPFDVQYVSGGVVLIVMSATSIVGFAVVLVLGIALNVVCAPFLLVWSIVWVLGVGCRKLKRHYTAGPIEPTAGPIEPSHV